MTINEDDLRLNAFIVELLQHGDNVRAYRATYDCSSMTTKQINVASLKAFNDDRVQLAWNDHKQSVAEQSVMTVVEVTKEFIDIATANAADLIQWRHRCCRYCHGIDHNYQWINEQEWTDATIKAMEYNATKTNAAPPRNMPKDIGGYGYDGTKRPVASCHRCWGIGEPYVWIADTRDLVGKARKLYAGVKQTANGVQIMIRDQDAALRNLATTLGMFADNDRDKANALQFLVQLSDDPSQASKQYREMVKASSSG